MLPLELQMFNEVRDRVSGLEKRLEALEKEKREAPKQYCRDDVRPGDIVKVVVCGSETVCLALQMRDNDGNFRLADISGSLGTVWHFADDVELISKLTREEAAKHLAEGK